MPRVLQADLERRVGATTIARLLDDNGDGIADAPVVADVLAEAHSIAGGILKAGFPAAEAREALFENDPAVRGAIADLALHLSADRRLEFGGGSDDNPHEGRRKRATEMLEKMATAQRRVVSEERTDVGPNAQIVTAITRQPRRDAAPVFLSSKRRGRDPGGF